MYRISKYHIGQQDAENLMKTVSLQRKGLMLVTLINFENTSAPAIARGSICDVANTLFESAGESILGTAVEGQNYIKLLPTSDDNIAAYYTQSAPTWNAELGGWYGVGDSANHRYIAGLTLSGSIFKDKYILKDELSLFNRFLGNGDFYQSKKIVTPSAEITNLAGASANVGSVNADSAIISSAQINKITSYTLGEISITKPKDAQFIIKQPTTIILGTYYISSTEIVDSLSIITSSGSKNLNASSVMSINPGKYKISSGRTGTTVTFTLCGAFGISNMLLANIFEDA